MIPSSADSDPSPGIPDATVEMERPKEWVPPPRSAPQGDPADATLEMERPSIPSRSADVKRKPARIAFDDNGPAHRTPFPIAPQAANAASPPPPSDANAATARPAGLTKSPPSATRLDATVEMERPSGLSRPPSSALYTRVQPPAARQDATLEMERSKGTAYPTSSVSMARFPPSAAPMDATVEMARPANLAKSPVSAVPLDAAVEMDRPAELTTSPSSAAPLDATVEMARPDISKESNTEKGRSAAVGPPALANLEATVEIERPSAAPYSPRPLPPIEFNATEAIDLSAPQPQRQSVARKSDAAKRETPTPGSAAIAQPKKLGEILVQMGKLSPEQVEEAVQLAQEQGERIGNFLLRWDLVQPETLCRALSLQSGLPMTMLDSDAMPEHLSKLFPLPLMMHHHFVPFDESGAVLCLAAGSPLDPAMIREQEHVLRKVIEVFIAREDQVARQLDWLRMRLKTRSRRSPRYNLRLSVSFQFCNRLGARQDKIVHTASTVNISEGGYLLECAPISADPSDMLLKGMYVNVCIKSMTGDIWAICDVREIRLIVDGREPKWLLGVEILDINPENKKRLKALCKRPAKPAQ